MSMRLLLAQDEQVQRVEQVALGDDAVAAHDADGQDVGVGALLADQAGDERAVPGVGVEQRPRRGCR